MRIVATAGHVDHGKSTLIRALTGTDPDRLPQEKARGMTIDLGFAFTTLASGHEVGFVDVPGHSRFLRNMLAGVGAVDACLFVVDAKEGWMPQSEEHLRILELLAIRRGLVVISKAESVDDDLRELAVLDVADHVRDTFLAEAETVVTDAHTGFGVDELRRALDRLVEYLPAAADLGRPRLWIDRSFPLRGVGTVVTGTLRGGSLAIGDEAVIEPGGLRVRVRSLESHYRSLALAAPGRRLAVNLTGVGHQDVVRGNALVTGGQWDTSRVVDASLLALGSLNHAIDRRGAFAVYVGSGDFPARLRVLGKDSAIEPGEVGHVRLWLRGRVPLPLVLGDRYVLRELGRRETIGGGQIFDVDPVVPPRFASPSLSVDHIIEERGWIDADHLERITGERRSPTAGGWVIAPERFTKLEEEIRQSCRDAGEAGVDLAGFTEIQRAILQAGVSGVAVLADRVVDESSVSTSLSEAATAVLAVLERTRLTPPDFSPSDRSALRELAGRGLACQAGELWFATSAVREAVEVLVGLVGRSSEGFTVSEARDALAISRKFTIPILGYLDAAGITRRRGDRRVAGPVMLRLDFGPKEI